MLLLINVILYLIVALIARKTAKVSPGLCARRKQKRATGIWVGWGGFILGFTAMMAAFGNNRPELGLLLLLAMLALVVTGMIMSRIVYPTRIDDRYVRLRGCGSRRVPRYVPPPIPSAAGRNPRTPRRLQKMHAP